MAELQGTVAATMTNSLDATQVVGIFTHLRILQHESVATRISPATVAPVYQAVERQRSQLALAATIMDGSSRKRMTAQQEMEEQAGVDCEYTNEQGQRCTNPGFKEQNNILLCFRHLEIGRITTEEAKAREQTLNELAANTGVVVKALALGRAIVTTPVNLVKLEPLARPRAREFSENFRENMDSLALILATFREMNFK